MKRGLTRLSKRVDDLVDAYAPNTLALGVIRILFALYILVLPVDYEWVGLVPGAFYDPPPGPMSFITKQPPVAFLSGLEWVRAALAVMVLVGFHTRAASILLGVVLVFGSGLTHSFNKIDHFFLLDMLPVFLAYAGWGHRLSLDARKHTQDEGRGLPMLLWAVTVGFALFTAALPKAVRGWLDPQREATHTFVAHRFADADSSGPLAGFLLELDSTLLRKFLDYSTIFAEAAVLVAILLPPLFRASILLMMSFHVGVYLALGINFAPYILVYSVFFAYPLARWFRPAWRRTSTSVPEPLPVQV